jgi:hypothetical protein
MKEIEANDFNLNIARDIDLARRLIASWKNSKTRSASQPPNTTVF